MAGIGGLVVVVALCVLPAGQATAGSAFLSALRLAKPKPDTAGTSLNAPLNGGRRLQDVLAAIVAESTFNVRDDPERAAMSAAAAEAAVGRRLRLIAARTDAPSITVLAAERVDALAHSRQLRTLLAQAGNRGVAVPSSLDGARCPRRTSRASSSRERAESSSTRWT